MIYPQFKLFLHINNKKMKRFSILTFLCFAFGVLLAQSPSGGVTIADSDVPPFDASMLEVISTNKGVLIPRMDKATMNAINPTSDGLMVFITEAAYKGYWYFDSGLNQWIKIKVAAANDKTLTAPMGGIVMYAGPFSNFDITGKGKSGTDKEGWAICNGENGTPNMLGQFVVGAKSGDPTHGEYATLGNKAGENAHTMGKENLPVHTHTMKPEANVSAPHTHTVNDPGHGHAIASTRSSSSGMNHIKRRRANKEDLDEESENDDYLTGGGLRSSNSKTGITIGENTVTSVNFEFPADIITEEGSSALIDNRPYYYVVVYMMRTDGLTNFSTPVPFNY
jgi:microcystin-dependent protein